jgi:formate C-acetyltransferase
MKEWEGFKAGSWQGEISVRDFIVSNYAVYKGSSEFLTTATERTRPLNDMFRKLSVEEQKKGGVLSIDALRTFPSGLYRRGGY